MNINCHTPFGAILSAAVVAYFLNLLWEVAHSMLYDWDAPPLTNNIYSFIPRMLLFATLLDALFVATIILWNALINGGFAWLCAPEYYDFIRMGLLGLTYAVVIELVAKRFSMWRYHRRMPVVLGVGLTPLVQLGITSAASVWIVHRYVLS